jgi:outer membrane protein TolC
MRDTHEPRKEFVEKLEWQVGLEVRRRNRAARAPSWAAWSPMKATVVVLSLMLVSMGIGAAGVVAAYETQGNARRDELTAGIEQRAVLARQRLAVATEELKKTERLVSVGVATNTEFLESRFKVSEAEAQFKLIELQLAEVRLTGREPRTEISAPWVSGRDFITERLRIEMSVPETAVGLERAGLHEAETRFQVGIASATDVDVARVRTLELEEALETFRKKLEIRKQLRTGLISPAGAELRALEAEANQRKKTLEPKVELARKTVDQVTAKVQAGTAQRVELTEATLRRLELETELAKADLDLTLVRRQIEQQRVGR